VRLRALALASALLVSACGGKGSQSPSSSQSVWLATVIDPSQDSELTIRPQDLANDPIFGPILQTATARAAPVMALVPGAKPAFDTFQKSPVVVVAARKTDPPDAVIIFEGVPDSLTVDQLKDPSGQPLFKKIDGAKGDAVEYDRDKNQSGNDPSHALHLVTLHGMWVVAMGPAVDRLHAAAASGDMRELHAEPGPLVTVSGVGEMIAAAKKEDHPAEIQPMIDGLSRIDMQLEGGQTAQLKVALTYADVNSATTAQNFLRQTADGVKMQKPELKPTLDQMTLVRDDAKVSFEVPLSTDFIAAVTQRGSASATSNDAPTDAPAQIPAKQKPKKSQH
jgi:hypothetical protein